MSTSEYHKDYYTRNKERILAGMLEKIPCKLCRCQVAKCNLPKHERSKKHELALMKRKEKDYEHLLRQVLKQIKNP